MAASPAKGARVSSDVERFQLIRPLGSGTAPFWAGLDSRATARARLVVVERVSASDGHGEGEVDGWLRNARMLATLEHMNVARVREVVVRKSDSIVASEYVDGVRWSELVWSAEPPPLEIVLRILIDALAGLSSIHNLRDPSRQPLNLVHGGLTPQAVVVGLEGVSKLVGAHRFRSDTAGPDDATSGYLAPEVLLADDGADARADIYSAGVLLWEALSGRPLYSNMQASAIVTQILGAPAPRATIPEKAPWAAPLADAAARALSADPARRHPSAAALAAELRRIAGPKLAQPPRVAALVRGTFGDVIRNRREALEGAQSGDHQVPPAAAQPARPLSEVPVDIDFVEDVAAVATPAPPPDPETQRPPPVALPIPTRARGVPRAILEETSETKIFAAKPMAAGPPRLPATALRVPPAPRVPRDLRPPEDDGIEHADAIGLESVPPSVPPTATTSPESMALSRRPQRRRVFVLLSSIFLLVPAILWWVAPRPHAHGDSTSLAESASASTAPSASPTTQARATATLAPEPPASSSATAATKATAETPTVVPQPTATASAPPEPPSTPPSTAGTTTANTAESPSPAPVWPPATTARPPTKKKYEPEGI